MIALTRARTKSAVPAKYRGDKRIDQALKLLTLNGTLREFEQTYWKTAKKQLKLEAANKCAYCESPTAVVAHGDVEHFRPKSIYWRYAYCYDNYLFACQICNQTYKSDNFPVENDPVSGAPVRIASPLLSHDATDVERREFARLLAPDPIENDGGQTHLDYEQLCRGERPLLLNPYTDEPERCFEWEADANLKEVVAIPHAENQSRAQASIEGYGLNREELLAERWKVYRTLVAFCELHNDQRLDQNLKDDVKSEIQSMTQSDAPYAGMCRFVTREKFNIPL